LAITFVHAGDHGVPAAFLYNPSPVQRENQMKFIQAAVAVVCLSLAAAASADSFSVTNTADSGPGSLRDAITRANATPSDDRIKFTVTGVLTPATPYPTTVGMIAIDSETPPLIHAVPLVEIDASALSVPVFHLTSGSYLHAFAIHGDHGAAVEAGDAAIIGNCFIGTDLTGATQMPNGTGILVTGAGVRLISNLISGNTTGVEITATAVGASIYDNRIGFSNSGAYAIPNGVGVNVSGNASSSGLAIGVQGLPNAISGNTGAGIRIASFNSVTILGNYIGTADYTGKAMGNGGGGIELAGSSNCSITENVIANNSGTAIWIGGGSGPQNHNLISKNTIARNGFGVDLGDTRDGHTANDALDGDGGPNGLLNHPVITMAVDNNTAPTPSATINGTLSAAPSSSYAVELFVNPNCQSGDYGAAETYLTTLNVTTDSSGNATFSGTFNSLFAGRAVSATATDAQNNTSELSNCAPVRTHGTFRFAERASIVVAETAGSFVVTVLRTGGDAGVVTVNYGTATSPEAGFYKATAGEDFAVTAGTLTFADGETSKTFTIAIFDDKVYETNEIFDLTLSNPTGGAVVEFPPMPRLRTYIFDDEPKSALSIARDTFVTEGNSGTTYAHVPVSLTPPAGFPVTVTFMATYGSATPGEDYQASGGSITFQPGEKTKVVDLPVFGDTKYELDETFGITLNLLSATPENDVTFDLQNYGAQITIVNDDVGKVLCTPSFSVTEGASGSFPVAEITCTTDSDLYGAIHYVTAPGGTAGPDDFASTSGSLYFNPQSGPQKIRIPIFGDDTVEPNEQFTINLRAEPSPPWNFIVEPAAITVTILNDDTPGVLRCNDVFAAEGNAGSKDVVITCVAPNHISGSIDYATVSGTAAESTDYGWVSGTVTFDDETTRSFTVPIFGDKDVESDEQFTIKLTPHPSASLPFTLAGDSVLVTIQNDDQPPPPPALLLAPARLAAAVGDTVQVRATIEPPSAAPVTIAIVAQDSTIVGVPSAAVIAAGQPAFISITAKKRGTTMVTVSAGAEMLAVLFVDVTEGSASLTSIEPSSGPSLGGSSVSLHGANLSAGCTAWFGGVQATSMVVSNATTATVVAPPHPAGTVDVTLTCGSASVSLPQGFAYVPVRGRAARH
jgi:parallel beta-helix repeat protein